MAQKRRATPKDGPSTVLPTRGSLTEPNPQAGDPAHENRRLRHVTMRHWITSFYAFKRPFYSAGSTGQIQPSSRRARTMSITSANSRSRETLNRARVVRRTIHAGARVRKRRQNRWLANVSSTTPVYTGERFRFQISLAYSVIVRSLENFPEYATLRMAFLAQASESWYRAASSP